jgi:hypothetical protein
MKKLLIGILTLGSISTFAASIELQSREFIENKKGEIIEVDGKLLDSKGNVASNLRQQSDILRGSNNKYYNTQHILIPATSEVRQALLNSSGKIKVEGTVLEEKTSVVANTEFLEVKVLVRDIE